MLFLLNHKDKRANKKSKKVFCFSLIEEKKNRNVKEGKQRTRGQLLTKELATKSTRLESSVS